VKNPLALGTLILSGLMATSTVMAQGSAAQGSAAQGSAAQPNATRPIASVANLAKGATESSDSLLKPRLKVLPGRTMLVITRVGDPDKVAGKAFRELYKYFYNHAPKQSEKDIPVPRARWPLAFGSQEKDQWVGDYGLPVPEGFSAPIQGDMRIEDWKYGLVAEILHVGPYSAEMATVDRLKDYIRFNGYAILGDFEEEYIVGPGLILKGNPDKYRTLIRLRLTRDAQTEQIAEIRSTR
jgi:effector-binding domain-containing protein